MYNTSVNFNLSDIIGPLGIGFYAIMIGYIILSIAGMWKLFDKFGEEGWKSIIPIYNIYILYKHSDLKPNLAFLIFVPCIGSIIVYILNIVAILNIAKKMVGKASGGFTVLTILLQPIAIALLAFNDKSLTEEKKEESNSIIEADVEEQPAIPAQVPAIPEAPKFDSMPTEEPTIPVQPEVEVQEPIKMGEENIAPTQNIAPPIIPEIEEENHNDQAS